MELLLTEAEIVAIWKRVSGYKNSALNNLYKRDISEFIADRKTMLAEIAKLSAEKNLLLVEVSRLTLALAECMARTVVITDPQQVDTSVYYAALDPLHASYAATEAALEATAGSALLLGYGQYEVADGGNGYTGLKIVGPFYGLNGLSIVASGLCRDLFNYTHSYNQFSGPAANTFNSYGDPAFRTYGSFLKAARRIPTTGEDRRIAQAKGTYAGSTIYIGQDNGPDGSDGSTYLKRRRIKDFLGFPGVGGFEPTVDPRTYDLVVLCDAVLSRFRNEGGSAYFYVGSGTSTDRVAVVVHPSNNTVLAGGPKIGGVTGDGEDADWTSDGGGMWHIDVTLGSAEFLPNTFVTSNAGGTLRGITRVANSTVVAATADSVAFGTSGGKDRIWVRLADGSNPKNTTYFGGYTPAGVQIATASMTYVDFWGLRVHQASWAGSFHAQNGEFALYNCHFDYVGAYPTIRAHQGGVTEATGQFTLTPHAPNGRLLMGCSFRRALAGIYDANDGIDLVPTNTRIYDLYCQHIGIGAAQAEGYGVECGSADDVHCIATMGVSGHYVENVRIVNCGRTYIYHYLSTNNYNDPIPLAIDDEPGYITGLPRSKSADEGDGTLTYHGRCQDVEISYVWATDPNTTNPELSGNRFGIQLGGDSDSGWGYADQVRGIDIHHNRIEGDFNNGSIKTKMKPLVYSEQKIHHNHIRGASTGFGAVGATVHAGVTYEPNFDFYENDVDASTNYARVESVTNPNTHKQILRSNIYRTNGGGMWGTGSGSDALTLDAWRLMAGVNDDYDDNSVHIAIGA